MSDIFLGLDQQDLTSLPIGFQGNLFVSCDPPRLSWPQVISLPSDVSPSDSVRSKMVQPSGFTEAFTAVFEHWSLESRTPSPSESKISSCAQPSSSTLVVGLSGQLSGFSPVRLSP